MNAHPGWMLVALGAVLLVGGLLWIFAPGIPFGRLPGDIRIENGATRIYIPIVTCLLLSLLLSAVIWVINYLAR